MRKERRAAETKSHSGFDPACPFCRLQETDQVVAEKGTVLAIRDAHPVTPGHLLIIPRRHTPEYFTLTPQEKRDADRLLAFLRNKIRKADPSVEGFNIGTNCGEAAGQTIMHAHIHLIPRRKGDTPFPQGGVRGVIPGKMGY
ncbi:MAG: HIT family protein [Armatimonadetes bacterium]|nr:HIT family protein [Armatimonadota bacterium]